MAAARERSASLRLPAAPDAPRRARDFLAAQCERWGVPQAVEAGALAVSELVTNAVRHAKTELRLDLRLEPGRADQGRALLIAVHDSGDGWPVIVPPDERELGGRGLAMVAKIAEAWGADADADGDSGSGTGGGAEGDSPTGKSVWCRIRVGAGA